MAWGLSEPQVRTLTFTTVVIADLSLILTNRSWNKALVVVFLLTLSSLFLVLSFLVLQDLFRFLPVPPETFLVSIGAGAGSVLWFEFYKFWRGLPDVDGGADSSQLFLVQPSNGI